MVAALGDKFIGLRSGDQCESDYEAKECEGDLPGFRTEHSDLDSRPSVMR